MAKKNGEPLRDHDERRRFPKTSMNVAALRKAMAPKKAIPSARAKLAPAVIAKVLGASRVVPASDPSARPPRTSPRDEGEAKKKSKRHSPATLHEWAESIVCATWSLWPPVEALPMGPNGRAAAFDGILRVAGPPPGHSSLTELAAGAPMGPAILRECLGLAKLLIEKNTAYGNSALQPMRVFSRASIVEQILVRLDDKLSRLARGSAAGEDVVLDLMGYLVLLRIAMREKGKAEP